IPPTSSVRAAPMSNTSVAIVAALQVIIQRAEKRCGTLAVERMAGLVDDMHGHARLMPGYQSQELISHRDGRGGIVVGPQDQHPPRKGLMFQPHEEVFPVCKQPRQEET